MMTPASRRRWLGRLAFSAAVLSSLWPAWAAEEPDETVPDDQCVLQLDLPEGATVVADGRDYGASRRKTRRAGPRFAEEGL
jgi:hypothetical protein